MDDKDATMKRLRATTRKISAIDARRESLVSERDALIRLAKQQGATWNELQAAAGMNSPTAVALALRRGLNRGE